MSAVDVGHWRTLQGMVVLRTTASRDFSFIFAIDHSTAVSEVELVSGMKVKLEKFLHFF